MPTLPAALLATISTESAHENVTHSQGSGETHQNLCYLHTKSMIKQK